MLSSFDDYPVHQAAEPIRRPATSDRNFYDRYYFNLHRRSDELYLVAGLGQYPNLGVQDAFVAVLHDGVQHVVRASRELGDRADLTVGPFRLEIVEPLRSVRVVCEPNEWGVALDATFEAVVDAYEEPRMFARSHERVTFDTYRFGQTGRWRGTLEVPGARFDVEPGDWWGYRARSWGIRPVGAPEPPGLRVPTPPSMYWNYAPMQFDDFTVFVLVQEDEDGGRIMEDACRLWPAGSGRAPEPLGRPEAEWEFHPGTRTIRRGTVRMSAPGGEKVEVAVDARLPMSFTLGTGYGQHDPEWAHGMYQGPLEVQGRTFDMSDPSVSGLRAYLPCEAVCRFEVDGHEGWGMLESIVAGPHRPTGLALWDDVVG